MGRAGRVYVVLLLVIGGVSAARAEDDIVASIKPIHSLVAAVMEGVGVPRLILEGANSPHHYSLKPSQASMIEHARVIFWVGPQLEAFLEKPIETIGSDARSVALIDLQGLIRREVREDEGFEKHDQLDEHAAAERAGDETEGGHHELDSHIWLDPDNARRMVTGIAEVLASVDPANAARYRANAGATSQELANLADEVEAMLAPVNDRHFIVFHDAYQYFEKRFGLEAVGSITLNPEVAPGAERIRQMRQKLAKSQVSCIFSEPQFNPKLVSVVIEGTDVNTSVIDPLGAGLEPGANLYFNLVRDVARSMATCLAGNS